MQIRRILLIGQEDLKATFTNEACGCNLIGGNLDSDYTTAKMLINGMLNNFIIYESCNSAQIYHAQAIIYLDIDPTVKTNIEKTRILGGFENWETKAWGFQKCFAINFYSLKITPKTCLYEIDLFIDLNKKLNNVIIDKSILVMGECAKNPESNFSNLPKEISLQICATLFFAHRNQINQINKVPFDVLPSNELNKVYFGKK